MALLVAGVLVASGCGDSDPGGPAPIETSQPVRTFAPLVLLAPDEPARPASARWFVERSVLLFAEDQGCDDREVAVGRTMPKRQNREINWIFYPNLGGVYWAYYRNPHDARCESQMDLRGYANQRIRPHHPGRRPAGIRPGEGFYLDLVDKHRAGPPSLDQATTYYERREDGNTLTVSYWMLYPVNSTRASEKHEGDWERVDVVLERDGETAYRPRALRFGAIDSQGAPGSPRQVPWQSIPLAEQTHPLLLAARGSHSLEPARAARVCPACERWRTWSSTEDARDQAWYGYGGAWGELGRTGITTGPLGPHGKWAADWEGEPIDDATVVTP